MVEPSPFRSALLFLDKLGVYDVILPFLLVFTIVFAILEKTKILGVEKIEGKEITKKNLNTIFAFVVAFLVVASTKLVAVINQAISQVVLLLILLISFLLLVGVFFGSKEFTLESYPGWITFFMIILFIGIILIFLNALGWLESLFIGFSTWKIEWTFSILLVVIVIGFMIYITWTPSPKKESKD